MPRPPSLESRQVQFLNFFDTRRYGDNDELTAEQGEELEREKQQHKLSRKEVASLRTKLIGQQREHDLILCSCLHGPLLEPQPKGRPSKQSNFDKITSHEMLELRSIDLMTEEGAENQLDDLESGKTLEVRMEFGHFDSDCTDDHGLYDLDISGNIQMHYDSLGRFCVEAKFDQDLAADFAKKLVSKRLDGGEIGHCDLRFWHVLCSLSPQLDSDLRVAVGGAMAPLRYPLSETLKAAEGRYFIIGPPPGSNDSNNRYRDGLLSALVDDATVYSVAQICVIFGKESDDELAPTTESSVFHAARDVTITRMISEAGLKPVFRKLYDARQITHILVPHAVAHRAEERYADLKDALIDEGISVPDSPMT